MTTVEGSQVWCLYSLCLGLRSDQEMDNSSRYVLENQSTCSPIVSALITTAISVVSIFFVGRQYFGDCSFSYQQNP